MPGYRLLHGTFESADGPYTYGTYLWARFGNLDKWERKLIEGPYIHHMAEIEGDYTAELKEFCKYIRYADLLTLDFDRAKNPASVCMCHVRRAEKNVVDFLEYHQTTCEGLFPFDDDVVIFVGAPGKGELSVENLEAFYVPKGTFVVIDPLIVHGDQYPVHREEAHIICLLPGRTFRNDTVSRALRDEADMAELILE